MKNDLEVIKKKQKNYNGMMYACTLNQINYCFDIDLNQCCHMKHYIIKALWLMLSKIYSKFIMQNESSFCSLSNQFSYTSRVLVVSCELCEKGVRLHSG